MGGQKSLRSYWRNYFEQTDGLVWVVDSADRRRLEDTAAELASLLKEERLAGATLLVLANKQDMPGALPPGEIEQVRVCMCVCVLGGGSGEICWPAGNPVAGRVRRWGWRHRGGGASRSIRHDGRRLGARRGHWRDWPCCTPACTSHLAQALNLAAGLGRRHWSLVGCSAVTGQGVATGFDWLVDDIGARVYMLD